VTRSLSRSKDEILSCHRCGIGFLWSSEERAVAADASQPSHCPACRLLLPEEGRERGLVKWYNARKQYGFILRRGQPDLFVHRSSLTGSARLQEGELVEFRVVDGEKGLMAGEVVVLGG
jgi:CspA family cold shock protein